jgi:hypothetical protein
MRRNRVGEFHSYLRADALCKTSLPYCARDQGLGGRPKTPLEIRQVIREMGIANPLWGAPRIAAAPTVEPVNPRAAAAIG